MATAANTSEEVALWKGLLGVRDQGNHPHRVAFVDQVASLWVAFPNCTPDAAPACGPLILHPERDREEESDREAIAEAKLKFSSVNALVKMSNVLSSTSSLLGTLTFSSGPLSRAKYVVAITNDGFRLADDQKSVACRLVEEAAGYDTVNTVFRSPLASRPRSRQKPTSRTSPTRSPPPTTPLPSKESNEAEQVLLPCLDSSFSHEAVDEEAKNSNNAKLLSAIGVQVPSVAEKTPLAHFDDPGTNDYNRHHCKPNWMESTSGMPNWPSNTLRITMVLPGCFMLRFNANYFAQEISRHSKCFVQVHVGSDFSAAPGKVWIYGSPQTVREGVCNVFMSVAQSFYMGNLNSFSLTVIFDHNQVQPQDIASYEAVARRAGCLHLSSPDSPDVFFQGTLYNILAAMSYLFNYY